MQRFFALMAVGLWLLMAGMAEAVTRYANASCAGCDASNSCAAAVTEGTPKQTINGCIACMAASDTCIVKNGVYNEVFTNDIPSGSVGNPSIVKSQNLHGAIIRPSSATMTGGYAGGTIFHTIDRHYITIDGFELDGTTATTTPYIHHFKIDDSHNPADHAGYTTLTTNIIIKNNKIHGGRQTNAISGSLAVWVTPGAAFLTIQNNEMYDIGIGAQAGHVWWSYCIYWHAIDSIIEGNDCHHASGWGIHGFLDTSYPSRNVRNVFRNNRLHHNGLLTVDEGGILVSSGGTDNSVYGNIVYSNGKMGIRVGGYGGPSINTKVYNNSIYANGQECILLGSGDSWGGSGSDVRNNICFGNGINQIVSNKQTSSTTTPNLFTNPLWVNPGAGNFHLQAGSPAIDTGANLSATVVSDFDGIAHAAPMEMGAYAYGGAPISPILLTFTTRPSTATMGQILVPSVQVCADDNVGNRQTSFANNITLTLTTGTGVLTGGGATAPTSGCSTFNVSISLDGVKRLTAAATGATSIVSNDFTINPLTVVGAPETLRLLYMP